MFIYQFNRLIRNRWLWGFFAFVIAFAFVGVPLVAQLDSRGRDGGVVGQLGRQRVTQAEFNRAHFFEHNLDRDPAQELPAEDRDRLTWERIAAVRTADRLGVAADEAEVGRAIMSDPSFQGADGQFDPNRYRMLLGEHMRMDPQTYEAYAAQRIAMMKLSDLLSAAVWIAPSELRAQIAGFTDEFTVQTLKVTNRYAQAEIDLDPEALARYYAEHGERFRLPERVSVRYTTFALSNFIEAIEIPVEDVRDFYRNHRERYLRPGATNDVEELIPFEDVESEILAELKRADAMYAARLEATEFATALYRDSRPDALETKAAIAGLSVTTSDWFHAGQTLPGIDADMAFTEAAFDLEADRRERRYSDVVPGRDFLYLMAAHQRKPSEIPPLDTVLPRVRQAAAAAERERLFTEQLETLHLTLSDSLTADADFTAAAADTGYALSSNVVFSVMEAFQRDDIDYADALARTVMRLEPGNLSRPERIPDGALLVFVRDRSPGDPLEAEMLREQVRQQQEQSRMFTVFDDWQRWNLDRLDFQRQARAADPETSPMFD